MLSWWSRSSWAHRISGYSASSVSFCPVLLLFLLLLWTGTLEPLPGIFSWKLTVLQAHTIESGNAGGLKTGQRYRIEKSTFIHALLHNQSVLSWKLDREPIGCVGVKKKSWCAVFGYSLGISSILATHIHGRNAAYPGRQSLISETFIHRESSYLSKLVGLFRIRLIKQWWNAK